MKNKDVMRGMGWDLLESEDISIAPKPPHGRIPNYKGSDAAAGMLRATPEWNNCDVIFCSPDTAQKKVREYALKDKKILIMASPKLKSVYLLIDPVNTLNNEKLASTIKGAFKLGGPLQDLIKVDLVVEGSVAVDLDGNRLGKGGGYGDLEISHLLKQKAIDGKTPIVSTVHEKQIMERVPVEDHDMKVNMIVSPERVIRIL